MMATDIYWWPLTLLWAAQARVLSTLRPALAALAPGPLGALPLLAGTRHAAVVTPSAANLQATEFTSQLSAVKSKLLRKAKYNIGNHLNQG